MSICNFGNNISSLMLRGNYIRFIHKFFEAYIWSVLAAPIVARIIPSHPDAGYISRGPWLNKSRTIGAHC